MDSFNRTDPDPRHQHGQQERSGLPGNPNPPRYGAARWFSVLRVGVIAALLAVFLIAVTLAVHFALGVPVGRLTRDAVSTLSAPAYIGFVSQAGIFMWAAAATVCLFVVCVLVHYPGSGRLRAFFLYSGALSLLLGIDDAFLLHERILPHFGVPQTIVLLGYVALVAIWLIRFRSLILGRAAILLSISLVFFTMSVLMDVVANEGTHIPSIYEDGAKVIGIVFWLAYFIVISVAAMVSEGASVRIARFTREE